MLDHSSLTQFLGDVVTEANHYRCDFFILMERICKEMPDNDHTNQGALEILIATRDCGCEWILPNDCDGKSYNWHSMLYHEKYNHIYKCKIWWESTPFGYERQIEAEEINNEDMVAWMYIRKSHNDTVNEIMEILK